jgi:hypothetical protein
MNLTALSGGNTMKKFIAIALLSLALVGSAFAKDHSNDYQMGTFISATAVADGTITSTLHGDGTTVAGDVYANHVGVYRIKVADGTWFVTTLNQTQDSMLRGMGMTPMHFKSEKANPLDGLKNGDKVLFRLHERRYLNGKFTLMAIPYADPPDKEVEFSTRFEPDVAPAKPEKTTDNVKAMCDSHKLSAELEKQYCSAPATTTSPTASEATAQAATQAIDLAQLAGKRVKVLRIPLCQPGTYTVDLTYAGKQATVLSVNKQTMATPVSSNILDRMPPAARATLEDLYASVTLVLQFDDGTKLDTCAPIGPRKIGDSVELLP